MAEQARTLTGRAATHVVLTHYHAGAGAHRGGPRRRVPASGHLGEWTLFNPRYFERAIGAWMKELGSV